MFHRNALPAALARVTVGCAGSQAMNARMKPMIGASEPELVAGMGAPEANLQPELGVRILQWRRETSCAVPNRLLFYQYSGDAMRPIMHSSTGMVSESCVAEWIVERGVAAGHRWQGAGCAGIDIAK